MGPQHERYAAWFEKRRGPRAPEDEAALLRVADAYDLVIERGQLTRDLLEVIVDGVSHQRALVWENSSDLMMKLSEAWPEAAEAILSMCGGRQAQVRFAALCSLGPGTPASITDAAIRIGLLDRSSRVRWKAAQRAFDLHRNPLIREMEAALVAEPDTKARSEIDLSLRLLRDGYRLEATPSGKLLIIVAIRNGTRGRLVSAEELETKGLEQVLREVREYPA